MNYYELVACPVFGCHCFKNNKFCEAIPDSKVHGANMGPTWVLPVPDGPHVGPMNLATRDIHPMFTLNAVNHIEVTCMLPFLDRRHGFVKLNFEGSKCFSVLMPWVIFQKLRGWFKLQYRKYHCANEMMLRRSYLYNGISFTDKMVSSYKIFAQAIIAPIIIQFPYINQGAHRKKLMQMI